MSKSPKDSNKKAKKEEEKEGKEKEENKKSKVSLLPTNHSVQDTKWQRNRTIMDLAFLELFR